MFKFAISVLLVAAVHQAFSTSVPVDDSPTLSQRLEIVGKAAINVLHSVAELGRNLTETVRHQVRSELIKFVRLSMARIALMTMASGQHYYLDEGTDERIFSPVEMKQFRVVATSVESVFGRLDTMEAANKLIVKTIRQAVKETKGREVTKEDLQSLVAALDSNFLAESSVSEVYKSFKVTYEVEIPLPKKKDPNYTEEPLGNNKKFLKSLINFVFIQLAYNRPTIKRDHFIFARSILELAKDSKKLYQVQNIYDETLSQLYDSLDLEQSDDTSKEKFFDTWFSKLKVNFEKHPSLCEELLTIQKDVAQRKDWDKGIFDLPV